VRQTCEPSRGPADLRLGARLQSISKTAVDSRGLEIGRGQRIVGRFSESRAPPAFFVNPGKGSIPAASTSESPRGVYSIPGTKSG
jgi:hypothetical protein